MLSPVQRQYLQQSSSRDGRRWAYTDEDAPIIDALVGLGMLEPARGECVYEPPRDPLDQVQLMGLSIPVRGRLLSLYRLTSAGQRAIAANSQPRLAAAR